VLTLAVIDPKALTDFDRILGVLVAILGLAMLIPNLKPRVLQRARGFNTWRQDQTRMVERPRGLEPVKVELVTTYAVMGGSVLSSFGAPSTLQEHVEQLSKTVDRLAEGLISTNTAVNNHVAWTSQEVELILGRLKLIESEFSEERQKQGRVTARAYLPGIIGIALTAIPEGLLGVNAHWYLQSLVPLVGVRALIYAVYVVFAT